MMKATPRKAEALVIIHQAPFNAQVKRQKARVSYATDREREKGDTRGYAGKNWGLFAIEFRLEGPIIGGCRRKESVNHLD